MADSAFLASSIPVVETARPRPQHSVVVRATHWITTVCFLALLITGVEILISHPRFYWGEAGNVLTPSLFSIPIPASRSTVPTGYGYVLPDQNGWSRYLHFQAAWLVVLTGLLYAAYGWLSGHFGRNLIPHRRLWISEPNSYNLLQRLTYLLVIFVLFPLVIWTGLAMSPAIASVFPPVVTVFGGQQSARTIHFFISILLALFVVVHVVKICTSGFKKRMRAMTIGGADQL